MKIIIITLGAHVSRFSSVVTPPASVVCLELSSCWPTDRMTVQLSSQRFIHKTDQATDWPRHAHQVNYLVVTAAAAAVGARPRVIRIMIFSAFASLRLTCSICAQVSLYVMSATCCCCCCCCLLLLLPHRRCSKACSAGTSEGACSDPRLSAS